MILSWVGVLILSIFFQFLLLRPSARDAAAIFLLCIYHFMYVFLFYGLTVNDITDSSNYYNWASDGWFGGYFGTGFVVSLIQLIQWFGVDGYFLMMLLFAALSAFGVSAFYVASLHSLKRVAPSDYLRGLLFLGLLIPGLHFWTAPIGKDSLILFSYGLMALSVSRVKGALYFLFGLMLVFLVRPHVGFCILMVFAAYKYFASSSHASAGLRLVYRLALIVGAVFFIFIFYGFILDYLQKYSVAGFDGLADFVSSRQDIYSDTGSGLSIASVPYIARYVLFFLGGIPWAVGGVFQLFSLIEGVVFLLLLFFAIRSLLALRAKSIFINDIVFHNNIRLVLCLILFVLLLSALLSYGSGNLGLMVRQRVMIYLPLLLSFLLAKAVSSRLDTLQAYREGQR